jgi:hypothetical protein
MRSGGSVVPSPYYDYEYQCLEWRRSLSEENLRHLTSDFLMGRRDAATADAFAEYEDRYGPLDRNRGLPSKNKKTKRSAKRRNSKSKQ